MSFISNMIGNYVDGMVAGAVQTAGTFAGDVVSGVGRSINGAGSSIESTIRTYGDGTIDYGNGIKDWTRASGPRHPTTSNPLGLSDTQGAGSRAMSGANFTRQSTKKAPPKALPAPAPKKAAPKALPAPEPKGAPKPKPANDQFKPKAPDTKTSASKAPAPKAQPAKKAASGAADKSASDHARTASKMRANAAAKKKQDGAKK